MKIKPTLAIVLTFFFGVPVLSAQTTEELIVIKEAKAAELTALETELGILTGRVDALKTEVADLDEILTPYPRWDLGATGNLGFNFSQYSDWLSKAEPNTNAVSLGFTVNANAHLDQPKYFWRNNLALALGWQKFDNEDDPTDDDEFKVATDGANLNSLYGYKIGKKIALSALADYRSSLLDGKFNNPGYLDLGVGATWIPTPNLVVVVHPLSYNIIFSNTVFDYKNSVGCKVLVDYAVNITKHITYKTNLAVFASYEGSDLSNWAWRNSITTSAKGLGIGLDFGLRGNKQEALAAGLTNNPVQTFWLLGLTYTL